MNHHPASSRVALNERYPSLTLPISRRTLRQLPHNIAYQYEFIDGAAELIPRPQIVNVLRSLSEPSTTTPLSPDVGTIRPLQEQDWDHLPALFANAFMDSLPFRALPNDESEALARDCIHGTRVGHDGPLVPSASFVVTQRTGTRIAAVLITLNPRGPLTDFTASEWLEAPPSDPVAARWGRPHLTWVFVTPGFQQVDLGATLLNHAISELTRLGFDELSSTFLLDNVPSLMWHWKHGFQLQSRIATQSTS